MHVYDGRDSSIRYESIADGISSDVADEETPALYRIRQYRSQERNREDAVARLLALIAAATERPKFRVKTRPTLASQRRRVDGKVKRGAVKRGRGRVPDA